MADWYGHGDRVAIKDSQTQIITQSSATPAPPVAAAFAYINDGDPDLFLYNITTPAAPTAAGIYNGVGSPWSNPKKRGDFLYMGDFSSSTLHVFSVANTAAPTEVATVSQPFGEALYVALDDAPAGCVYLGISGDQRIDVWDAIVPAAPVFVASQPTTSGDARSLAQQGGNLFVLEYLAGPLTLRIYSSPCTLFTLEGEVDITGYTNDAGVAVPGDGFAYVGGTKGVSGAALRVVDVSDITNPTLRGELIFPGAIGQSPVNIVVDGDFAYVCYGFGFGTGRPPWYVVAISDPDNPTLIATVTATAGQQFFAISKIVGQDQVWLIRFVGAPPGNACSLVAYDVSTPATPTSISSTPVDSSTQFLLVA